MAGSLSLPGPLSLERADRQCVLPRSSFAGALAGPFELAFGDLRIEDDKGSFGFC